MINKLFVKDEEILRYLGHKNQQISQNTMELINWCKNEISNNFEGKYIYECYDLTKESNVIKLLNTSISLTGKDIYKHLNNCNQCVLMATTLGINIDKNINYYFKENITKAIIFDACATAFIESLCDYVEVEIKKDINSDNLTSRFSPGYGDLSINIQPIIINQLDAYRRIGLAVNESLILIPKKSVTAIIGVGDNFKTYNKCSQCIKNNNCNLRKEGTGCGF